MNIQKIINNVNSFLKRNKRRNKRKSNIFLNKNKSKIFKNRRKNINIKNTHLEKLKIFGNNIKYYYIAIIILLLTLTLYVIFGPIFKIKSIEIIKQDNITNMQRAYKAVDIYRGKSIFKIEKNEILNRLKDYQNNIKEIKTSIILPDTLKITIDSHESIFNTNIIDKDFLITSNGTLIPGSPSEELKNITIKDQFERNNLYDYKKTIDEEYLNKILSIVSLSKENIINLKLKDITYFVIERELHLETENDITVIFDLNGDYKEQIEKLAIFNKDSMDITKAPLIYIDLRIKNKIFHCSRENEYSCIKNLKSIYSYE